MDIHCGSDHRGFQLKQQLIAYLEQHGHRCIDHGCAGEQRVDYPDFAAAVGAAVAATPDALGIVICGSGTGISIAANKMHGIRCVAGWCEYVAEYGRRHNHANVLALGADLQTYTQAVRCVDAFLAAQPEPGRHAERVEMIARLEEQR